jgi:hypothetical protein
MRPAVDLSHSRAVVLQGGGAVHLANGAARPGASRAPPPSAMAGAARPAPGAAMAWRGGGGGGGAREPAAGDGSV